MTGYFMFFNWILKISSNVGTLCSFCTRNYNKEIIPWWAHAQGLGSVSLALLQWLTLILSPFDWHSLFFLGSFPIVTNTFKVASQLCQPNHNNEINWTCINRDSIRTLSTINVRSLERERKKECACYWSYIPVPLSLPTFVLRRLFWRALS